MKIEPLGLPHHAIEAARYCRLEPLGREIRRKRRLDDEHLRHALIRGDGGYIRRITWISRRHA